jgi:hypothetical protein
MRWAPLFAAAIVSVAGCSGSDPGPTYTLIWKLKPGDEFEVGLRQESRSNRVGKAPEKLKQLDLPVDSSIQALLKLKVTREAKSGEVELELTPIDLVVKGRLGSLTLDIELKDGKWIRDHVDTGRDLPPEKLAKARQQIRETLARPSPGRARSFGMTEGDLKGLSAVSMIFRMFPSLPPEAVPVNGTWLEKSGLEPFAGVNPKYPITVTNRLESIRLEPDGPLALIETQIDREFEQQGVDQTVKRIRRGTFDIAGGHYTRLVDDQTSEACKGEFKATIKVTTEITVRRER